MEDKPQRVSLGAVEESNGFASTIANANIGGSKSPILSAEELEELEYLINAKDNAIQQSNPQRNFGTQNVEDGRMEEISTILRGSVSKAKEAGDSVKGNGISIQEQIDIESRTALNYAKENKDNETGNTKTDRQSQPTSGESNGRIAEIALLTGATDESGKPSIQSAQPSKSEQEYLINAKDNAIQQSIPQGERGTEVEDTRRAEELKTELERRSGELQRIATEKTIELANSLIIGGSNDVGRGVHPIRNERDMESSTGDLPYNINPAVSKRTSIKGFKVKGYVNFFSEQITGHPDVADHWRTTTQILRNCTLFS